MADDKSTSLDISSQAPRSLVARVIGVVRGVRRPNIRVESLVLLVVTFMIAATNGSWWHAVMSGRAWSNPATWTFIASCFVALVALHFAVFAAVSNRWIVKPLLTLIVIAAAGAVHFMALYAVIMDPSVMQNVLRTDTREARDLLSLSMAAWVVAISAIPVAFIWWVRLKRINLGRALLVRVGAVCGALLIAVLAVFAMSRDFTSLMRNQREARYLITPGNLIYGLGVNSVHRVADAQAPRQVVGEDAKIVHIANATKPRVFVLVVGETARAANFSLMGYSRTTNPELGKLDIMPFRDATSCGTSTEVSVPCRFSPYGRENYDERRIRSSEGLLDVLARAGYAVKWIDNQSGCKGVCTGKNISVSKTEPKA